MIGVEVQIIDQTKRVIDASDRATFRNVGHAAATIRRDAIESIIVSQAASRPGTPPHTRRRQLKRAIRFDNNKDRGEAVIGPQASIVGEAGSAHEFGGVFKGQAFPERAFMGPALDRNRDRFAAGWAGSIGE